MEVIDLESNPLSLVLSNKIWNNHANYFVMETLPKYPNLTTLKLDHSRLGYEGMMDLIKAFKNRWMISLPPLKHLEISRDIISPESARILSNAIIDEYSGFALSELNLILNKLGDTGLREISRILCSKGNLRRLSIMYNEIGERGLEDFSRALRINTSLKKLNLSGNAIGDRGVVVLAQALLQSECREKLQQVVLFGNHFGDEGARALAQLLIHMNEGGIGHLNLGSNNIGISGLQHLSQALRINLSLTTLLVNENDVELIVQQTSLNYEKFPLSYDEKKKEQKKYSLLI